MRAHGEVMLLHTGGGGGEGGNESFSSNRCY